MGTKNQPGKFDCYANALPDEPMFVLLARDSKAARLVRLWAEDYKAEKENSGPIVMQGDYMPPRSQRRLTVDEYAKYCEALDCADAMDKWAQDYRNAERIKTAKRDAERIALTGADLPKA